MSPSAELRGPHADSKVLELSTSTRVKGLSTCHAELAATVNNLDVDVAFDCLAHPGLHATLPGVKEVLAELVEEDGPRRTWRLTSTATWRFWKFHGSATNHLVVESDRDSGEVIMRLATPGFLKAYEGRWMVTDASGAGPGQARRARCGTPGHSHGHGSSPVAHSLASINMVNPLSLLSALPAHTFSMLRLPFSLQSQPQHPQHDMPQHHQPSTTTSPNFFVTSSSSASAPTTYIRCTMSMAPKLCPPFPMNAPILKSFLSAHVEELFAGLLMAAATPLQDLDTHLLQHQQKHQQQLEARPKGRGK